MDALPEKSQEVEAKEGSHPYTDTFASLPRYAIFI
jgi:hypothetical protein